ncbi:MAG TPA: hypothetical protein VJU15_02575 [Gemmatimonadales bacterium]|nr:hypothetical protein [Gemmatimonadales bacterium]
MGNHAHTDRRTFLAAMGAVSIAGTGVGPTVRRSAGPTAKWDMSWLEGLKGKHKQVFDVASVSTALHAVANYLDAFEEVYTMRSPEVNTVVGIAGKGFAYNATDRLWGAYKLGEKFNVKDPDTGVWSARNIFYDKAGAADTVVALQRRGTIFWMCNNALTRLSKQWADEAMKPWEDVKKDLIAGLNPGVIVVPAHTMLLGLCQERGCTYQMV